MSEATQTTSAATASEPKKKWTEKAFEKVTKVHEKALGAAVALEFQGFMAVADALAAAKDDFESQLLSYNDDFLPWAAKATAKSEESVKTYLNARACFRTTPNVPQGIGKEALNELFKVKDIPARVSILEETKGDTMKTRKAVKAYRESILTAEQRTAKAEREANRKAKALETAVTAVQEELFPIMDRVRSNMPETVNDVIDLIVEIYRLGSQRDEIAGEAVGTVAGNWYAKEAETRDS